VICPAEQTCVIDAAIYDTVLAEFERMGARLLRPEETERLTRIAFDAGGHLNAMALGRPVSVLAGAGGIEVSAEHKVLLAELPGDLDELVGHPLVQEKLMPILAVVRATSEEHALEVCDLVTETGGLGHTAAVYASDEAVVERFADRIRRDASSSTRRPPSGALGGVYNAMTPTFSLGCGTWGGSTTTENVNYRQLLNVKAVARRRTPPQWFRAPSETAFGAGSVARLRELRAAQVVLVTSPGQVRRGVADEVARSSRARPCTCCRRPAVSLTRPSWRPASSCSTACVPTCWWPSEAGR
jgi:acetaldehyde dehydrogenase/alcohol dehydrogenase